MTRVGLIGIGRQGQRWARIAKPEVILRRKDEDWFTNNTTTDLRSFFAQCDHVIIASPPELHAEQVAACLEAGKRVLCEKPLCETGDDARFLERLQVRCEGDIWVAYPHLFHPAVESHPGKGIDAECVFRGPTPREPLLDWGPHALSAGVWLLGGDASLLRCAVSKDRKRAQVDLESDFGRVRCDFGESEVKTTRIKLNTPVRRIYTGEACEPDPMTRMFRRWVGREADGRTELHLSVVVHELLDEVRGG